jgi:hypothetical protein
MAIGAIQHRFIFPEFHLCITVRAQYVKYIFRLPVLLILSRAERCSHNSPRFRLLELLRNGLPIVLIKLFQKGAGIPVQFTDSQLRYLQDSISKEFFRICFQDINNFDLEASAGPFQTISPKHIRLASTAASSVG